MKMKQSKSLVLTLVAMIAILVAVPMATADNSNGKSPGDDSIVDIASADARFSTLVDLVVFAELDDVLSNDGQFTVFAPTNDAFAALIVAIDDEYGTGTAATLLADKDFVTNVLLYHVTDGRRYANSVFNQNNSKYIEMLNGGAIWANPDLTLTDTSSLTNNAGIVAPDFNISASNGVIHVIDAVLVP
jgi:adhesin HecA-like repeat protein